VCAKEGGAFLEEFHAAGFGDVELGAAQPQSAQRQP
jgi:hypothetical protein